MLLGALLAGLFTASSVQGQEQPASTPETKAPAAKAKGVAEGARTRVGGESG